MTEEPQICPICTTILDPTEHPKFHIRCMNCTYCHLPVPTPDVERMYSKGPIAHQRCEDHHFQQELKKRPVEVSQKLLDYLNQVNLMFSAKINLSLETNGKEAAYIAGLLAVDMTFDQLAIVIRRMEFATAAFSMILSKNKGQKQLAMDLIDSREREKFKEVTDYRDKQAAPKKVKEVKPYKAPAMSKAEKDQAAQIKAFKMMGLSDDTINLMLTEAKKFQEKATQ